MVKKNKNPAGRWSDVVVCRIEIADRPRQRIENREKLILPWKPNTTVNSHTENTPARARFQTREGFRLQNREKKLPKAQRDAYTEKSR
jgi:hypothetical protein